tara:strand:- start:260 stop:571 length:312 start_codon:yes stop_codon:yes gene_type:complete
MEYKFNKSDAISSLRPSASFGWNEETGVISQWSDPNGGNIPSDSEITTEITRLQTEYDVKNYQRKREIEYPDWKTQLDYIYHHGVDKWKTDIVDPIKSKYPKP